MTVKQVGDSALLMELEPRIDPDVNARAIAVAAALRRRAIAGVRDIVSTYRSVAVHFDPLKTCVAEVEEALTAAAAAAAASAVGPLRVVNVPVVYGGSAGPDLAEVASLTGLSEADVIARHWARDYRVFMLGFMPGFPYLGLLDAAIEVPRLSSPRVRVPAGSVAIAGRQTGIYPWETPGGWRIIGRTGVDLFDESCEPPARLTAGDTVRFVPVSDVGDAPALRRRRVADTPTVETAHAARAITVLRPGMLTTVQDLGRRGHQHLGVGVAGSMDGLSHRLANLVVGNGEDAATLEVTLVGPELRIDAAAVLAVCGADLSPSLDGAEVALGTPLRVRAGSVLRFGQRRAGFRAYVACDGGIDVPRVLGSRSTHLPSQMGGCAGRALQAGDRLPLGESHASRTGVSGRGRDSASHPSSARLRVLPGPQEDGFRPEALELLCAAHFTVSPQSNRVGYRLAGGRPIAGRSAREMISDATFPGSIQVPPSGEPILLMADRQTTGGYPQIATVISADLPCAAQLGPGDRLSFEVCTPREALAALIEQEGTLLDIR